jgi:hypothetical protein
VLGKISIFDSGYLGNETAPGFEAGGGLFKDSPHPRNGDADAFIGWNKATLTIHLIASIPGSEVVFRRSLRDCLKTQTLKVFCVFRIRFQPKNEPF